MPEATETDFFERADMLDTKVGQGAKDDPADVARVGFDAMMRGDDDVVSGWKNKLQSAETDLSRLLCAEAQTFRLLWDDARYPARDAPHPPRNRDGHRGTHLRALHRNDVYMRDLELFAPADCIVSNTATDNDHALRQIATVLKSNITDSQRLTFRRARTATLASGRLRQESKR
jgi:hypothetical protein